MPLTNDTKSSILDVAGVLVMSLEIYFVIGTDQGFSPWVKNKYFLEHLCIVAVLLFWWKFMITSSEVSIFSKAECLQPGTLLKMNSYIGFFYQGSLELNMLT